jgi:hypothetical protein
MRYLYAPIYKYLALLVIFFLFVNYYKNITNDKFLPIITIFVTVVIIVDHMIIFNHPHITADNKEGFDNLDEDLFKDIKKKSKYANLEDEEEIDEDLLEEEEEYTMPKKTTSCSTCK